MRRAAVGCALFAGLACFASAETVYRCGPTGNSYSQTPCDEGRTLDASDRRDADHVTEARRVAEIERRLGDSLERERLRQERARSRTDGLSSLSSDKPAAQKASKSKKDGTRDFTVKLPKQKKNSSTP
jgi:hypothetical protein